MTKMKVKKCLLRICCLCAGFLLFGCDQGIGMEYNAAGYVEAVLKNVYLGDSSAYCDFVDVSAEEAKKEYEGGMEVETDFFFYQLALGEVSEETHEQYEEFYKELYQNAQFEVNLRDTEEQDGEQVYKVEVVIKPITFFSDLGPQIDEIFDAELEKDYPSEKELDEGIATAVLELLNANKGNINYGDEEIVLVTIEKDEDGLWYFDDEDFNTIDGMILTYLAY